MKVYITKYALTGGIKEHEAEKDDDFPDSMIRIIVSNVNDLRSSWYFHKPHWHESKAEAIEQSEKMRVKKIDSLEKKIAKLKAMKFE